MVLQCRSTNYMVVATQSSAYSAVSPMLFLSIPLSPVFYRFFGIGAANATFNDNDGEGII